MRGIHRSPVNSPHKGQWRRAFMFSLICARVYRWVNNREAGDLRRYRAPYDVMVMWFSASMSWRLNVNIQGAESIWRCHLTSIGNPIVQIRRSYDRLISTMGFPILIRWHLYIESGPRSCWCHDLDIFSALLSCCEGHPPITGGFPSQKAINSNFKVFFVESLRNLFNKQSSFQTPGRSVGGAMMNGWFGQPRDVAITSAQNSTNPNLNTMISKQIWNIYPIELNSHHT